MVAYKEQRQNPGMGTGTLVLRGGLPALSFQLWTHVIGHPACSSGAFYLLKDCWLFSSWKLLTYHVIQEDCTFTNRNTNANGKVFQKWSSCPCPRTGTNDSVSCELTLAWLREQRDLEGLSRGVGGSGFCLIWGPQLSTSLCWAPLGAPFLWQWGVLLAKCCSDCWWPCVPYIHSLKSPNF